MSLRKLRLITSLGPYNTHFALILPVIAGGKAFYIHVLRNFIEEIPQDLFDAIKIDGGTVLQQIIQIVVPLSMPVIGTLGILCIPGQWNNFVSPLLFLRDTDLQTISVALLHLEGEYTKQWGQLMAVFRAMKTTLKTLCGRSSRVSCSPEASWSS